MTPPSMSQLFRVFGRIGVLSFGGPAAQIGLMHRELVETRPWLSEDGFLRALSLCMLLPGPEAMQLATYAGWKLRGIAGGILAGALFVLPGAAVIAGLLMVYVTWGDVPWVQAGFVGVQAAVVAIVIQALRGLSKRALKGGTEWAIAAASFVAIFAAGLPFPIILAAAAMYGAFRGANISAGPGDVPRADWAQTLRVAGIWLGLWLIPLVALSLVGPVLLSQIGWFFAWLATISFGGAYALLAYMTQTVVTEFGWISTAQMIDALGLAETTPGPLILVTQFVAMLTAHGAGGLGLAVIAGVVGLWATFLPCFLFIFAAAPHIERLANAPRLQGALNAITAAVVGVILNLSVWFALNVFFTNMHPPSAVLPHLLRPDLASVDVPTVMLFCGAAALMFAAKLPLPWVLALSAAAGIVVSVLGF